MVYEFRKYNSFKSFKDEDDSGVIVWETDETMSNDNIRPCGKLIACVSDERNVRIPDGIEVLAHSFLVPTFWGGWGSSVNTVHIPASVKTIEEGAFASSHVNDIEIDPKSHCGIVKNNGLFTEDGKTLIWVLDYNNETEDEDEYEYEYVVPDDVERIGVDFHNGNCFDVLVVSSSVTHIGYNKDYDWLFDDVKIRAPKDSYAIRFAKEHNIEFEEIN